MRALGYNPDDTLPKTFDLDRIEVLRGPQGTLFGSGSEGGTVRYIMTQPSVSTASTYARTELSFTKNGDPSYEAGLAHGGPLIDDVLGYRASIWYRKDGGWINRVDSTSGALTEKNANYADTVSARLALLIKPNERLRITPSVTYQNSRKHDESTYWTAYSQPDAGVFNNATPERIPVPDEYYLPALKIEADIGKTTLVSNSSYYNRYEQSGYQGTVYDLGYYQNQGWLIGQYAAARPHPSTAFYLDVGTKESEENVRHREDVFQRQSQIEATRRFRDVLLGHGCEVNYREFDGGHDCAEWKKTLPAALVWALPPAPRGRS